MLQPCGRLWCFLLYGCGVCPSIWLDGCLAGCDDCGGQIAYCCATVAVKRGAVWCVVYTQLRTWTSWFRGGEYRRIRGSMTAIDAADDLPQTSGGRQTARFESKQAQCWRTLPSRAVCKSASSLCVCSAEAQSSSDMYRLVPAEPTCSTFQL